MTLPLLKTKLHIPVPRPAVIPRPRLIDRLTDGIHVGGKLILISAPAGFGKTTLIGEWVHHTDIPVAWLSLDKEDNDPNRFWTYLIAALQTIHPDISASSPARRDLQSFASVERGLPDLISDIAVLTDPFVLILDDLHVIKEQTIHRWLLFLVENLPPQMHMIISSRVDPPWPLARMRAQGRLAELRSRGLRFSLEEVTAFVKATNLNLSDEAVTTLCTRTEGWVAGLQMAALSMQGQSREETTAFLGKFGGGHRFILDYLIEEVLDRQPAHLREFLLKTSVLDRMTASLCDALIAGTDQETTSPRLNSRSALAQIEQANVFLVALDEERRWYRYHHLFAELLRNRLQQRLPDEVPVYHRAASRWYETNGLIAEAIHHALQAGDTARVLHLVEHNVLAMVEEGAIRSVVHWTDRLASETVGDRPWLDVARAWSLANAGHVARVASLLEKVETTAINREAYQALIGHVAVVRAYVALSADDLDGADRSAQQALTQLADEDTILRGYLHSLLNITHVCKGDLKTAAYHSSRAIPLCRRGGDIRIMTSIFCDSAALEIARGRFHKAARLCREALDLVAPYFKQSGRALPVAGRAHNLLSGVLYEWNDLPGAVHHARKGVARCQHWGQPEFLASAYSRLARVMDATGDEAGAIDAIRAAIETANQVSASYAASMAARQARLWLAHGNTKQALTWAQTSGLHSDDAINFDAVPKYESLARVYMAQGQDDPDRLNQAAHLLENLLAIVERAGAAYFTVRILVLQAVAAASNRVDRARTTLARAVDLAEPQGYIRVFLDESDDIGNHLLTVLSRQQLAEQTVSKGTPPAYKDKLQSALQVALSRPPRQTAEIQSSAWVEPLSERESEVLQLVAEGLSNREIAQTLVIALNTVKNHLKNIYGKLAVHSRTQAVHRARTLNLL